MEDFPSSSPSSVLVFFSCSEAVRNALLDLGCSDRSTPSPDSFVVVSAVPILRCLPRNPPNPSSGRCAKTSCSAGSSLALSI